MMQGLEDISNSMDVIERELRIREQLKEAVEILPLVILLETTLERVHLGCISA